jgi:hypothetical protein
MLSAIAVKGAVRKGVSGEKDDCVRFFPAQNLSQAVAAESLYIPVTQIAKRLLQGAPRVAPQEPM